MERLALIEQLNTATDKAAKFAIKRGMPISNNKQGMWVGNTLIKQNTIGLYDIFTLDKKLIFTNISVFDVATIVSQRYTTGEFKVVQKVLVLEHTFAKHHTDMIHYLHCIRAAKRRRDYDTMAILEDKFQVSEIRAKHIRDNISFFKKVK